MATNFVQEGRIVTLSAPVAAVVCGQPIMWGNLFGVCLYSAVIGSPVEVQVDGVWGLLKTAGVVFAAGALVYWDPIALYGRSRPFALSHDALDRLLAVAEELERRGDPRR